MIHPKSIKIIIPEGSGKRGSKYAGVVEKYKRFGKHLTIPVIYDNSEQEFRQPEIEFLSYGEVKHRHTGDITLEKVFEILKGY